MTKTGCAFSVSAIAGKTPAKEWNPHRFEVAPPDDADPGEPLLLKSRFRASFDLETVGRAEAAHGQVVDETDASDPREMLDALQELAG